MLHPEKDFHPGEAETFRHVVERYPPPYRLTCDLAMFPMVISASRAAAWAGMSVVGALGQTLLLLMAVRYYHAQYGPAQTSLHFQTDHPDLYREVACVVLSGILPGFSFTFPRLWLDTPDPTPLELGWYYGFPKVPATIEFLHEGRTLDVTAWDERGAILAVGGRKGVSLPPRLVTAMAFGEGIFPRTGLRARMRLDGAAKLSLLQRQRWELPRLDLWGVGGHALFGLWLEGATVVLDAPEQLWPCEASGAPKSAPGGR